MAPSGARPGMPPARGVCSLSRLPRPAPPRSEFGEGSRGAELRRPAAVRGARGGKFGFRWQVVGEGRAHARVRGAPPHPEGRRGDGGVGKGGGGLPVPPAFPFPPCLLSRASLPLASTSRPLSRCGRVARGACRVLSGECGCRLVPPPFLGGVPTAGGIAGALLLPPSTGFWRIRDSRGWPRSRGRTLFGGTAVGRVRRDVGRRGPLPRVGLRRLASVSASAFPRAGWRLLGFPRGVPRSRVGSVPRAWRDCSRGSGVQRDSRRFSPRVPGRRPPERSPPVPL